MSGTFPATPKPRELTLIDDQPVFVDIVESGKRQSRIAGGHLWRMKLTFPPMTRAQFAPIFAFIASQRGAYESFQIVDKAHDAPQGVGTGTPTTAPTSAGATLMISNGWTGSQTGIMKAGDLFKVAGHSKVYMMTADVNSTAGGQAALQFIPPLIQDVGGAEAITVNDVPFTMIIDGDVNEWKTTNPAFSSYSLDLVEAL